MVLTACRQCVYLRDLNAIIVILMKMSEKVDEYGSGLACLKRDIQELHTLLCCLPMHRDHLVVIVYNNLRLDREYRRYRKFPTVVASVRKPRNNHRQVLVMFQNIPVVNYIQKNVCSIISVNCLLDVTLLPYFENMVLSWHGIFVCFLWPLFQKENKWNFH